MARGIRCLTTSCASSSATTTRRAAATIRRGAWCSRCRASRCSAAPSIRSSRRGAARPAPPARCQPPAHPEPAQFLAGHTLACVNPNRRQRCWRACATPAVCRRAGPPASPPSPPAPQQRLTTQSPTHHFGATPLKPTPTRLTARGPARGPARPAAAAAFVARTPATRPCSSARCRPGRSWRLRPCPSVESRVGEAANTQRLSTYRPADLPVRPVDSYILTRTDVCMTQPPRGRAVPTS